MKEECLICKAPLVYLDREKQMECVICHKTELSNTQCGEGHYVCNECHIKGLDTIMDVCLNMDAADPIDIFEQLLCGHTQKNNQCLQMRCPYHCV